MGYRKLKLSIMMVMLSICMVACGIDSLKKLEIPTKVITLLSEDVIRAGQNTIATCIVEDQEGKQLTHLLTTIESLDHIDIDDKEISSIVAGSYEVQCVLDKKYSDIVYVPAYLTVQPHDPIKLKLIQEPAQTKYAIGDYVEIEPILFDKYDNRITADGFEWEFPHQGIEEVTSAYGKALYFLEEGTYEISASYYTDYATFSDDINLICDTTAPQITITSPMRAQNIQGILSNDAYIEVSGTIVEGISEITSFTINGKTASIDEDGQFLATMDVKHGLNVAVIYAEDAVGNRSRESVGFYYADTFQKIDHADAEANTDLISRGIATAIGQDLIDDGQRDCAFDSDTDYICYAVDQKPAYDDMATIAEVLINKLDLSELADTSIYNSGWLPLADIPIKHVPLSFYSIISLIPYDIQGDFVFQGRYRVYSQIVDVNMGIVKMGDQEEEILGLETTSNGINFLAYMLPQNSDNGMEVVLDVHLEFEFDLVYSIDTKYNDNNGIWKLENDGYFYDVTNQGCGTGGILALIDTLSNLFLAIDPNLDGYICNAEPVTQVTPNTYTGATIAQEKAKIASFLEIGVENNAIAITAHRPTTGYLVDLLNSPIHVDTIDPLVVDLSDITVFGGLFAVHLGQFTISNFQPYLQDFLNVALGLVSELIEPVIEDLMVCDSTITGCPLTIDGYLEQVFNLLQFEHSYMEIPAIDQGFEDNEFHTSAYFNQVEFTSLGGMFSYDYSLYSTVPSPLYETSDSLGVVLQGGCRDHWAIDELPFDYELESAMDYDLINHALYSYWLGGSLLGEIELPQDKLEMFEHQFDRVQVSYTPSVSPIITRCASAGVITQLQFAALKVDLSFTHEGKHLAWSGWIDAAYQVQFDSDEGKLVTILAEPLIFEATQTSIRGLVAEYMDDLLKVLEENLIPNYLKAAMQSITQNLPLPIINIGNSQLHGLPNEVLVPFYVDNADALESTVIMKSYADTPMNEPL